MSYEYVGIEVMGRETYPFQDLKSLYTLLGVLFGAYTQSVLCWIKPKTGALESTVIREKHAQRNEAFNFQEANQTRKPPQYITSLGWPISPQGPSHSK